MRIFLGPAGIPLSAKGEGTPNGIRNVKELGLCAMEVEFTRGVHMKNETAEKVGQVREETGIMLSVHAPYYINLASIEQEKIKASKIRIIQSCERAHYMGANPVVFHPGFYGNYTHKETYEIIKEGILDIIDKMKQKGLKTKIAMETTGKASQFGSLDELIMMLKEIGTKYCTICVDFAHLWARNIGNFDYNDGMKKIKTLNLDHLHSHFSQIEYTGKGERRHLTFDDTVKSPPVETVCGEIIKSKQNITIISESPVLEVDSLKMKEVFERLGHKF